MTTTALLRKVQTKTTSSSSKNPQTRSAPHSSTLQVFLLSCLGGASALLFNFLLRVGNLAAFPPESALEALLRFIPESIQEPSVQSLGDFAGQLALIVATIIAVLPPPQPETTTLTRGRQMELEPLRHLLKQTLFRMARRDTQ